MRFKTLAILLLTGFIGHASVPKDGSQPKLQFGINEFNKALSYNTDLSTIHTGDILKKYFDHLEKRQTKYKKELQFIEYSFYYIHKKLLKKYSEYVSINETIENGLYDCVTATAIYALFFTELEIPYSVIETNYHIYVLVYPETNEEVLIETTDPITGFITNPDVITERKHLYARKNAEVEQNQIDLGWNIETSLKESELIGVLLLNQSIKQFNLGNKTQARNLAQEALTYYESKRIRTYLSFIQGNQYASN